MNKTGSSSIQRTFASYEDDDWRYLQLGRPNHSAFFAMAFLDQPPRHIVNGLELDGAKPTREGALAALRAELRRDGRSVVISGEGLSNFCNRDTAQAITGVLKEDADEVAALAYVRDPVSFASSVFQQVVRQSLPDPDLGKLLPGYRGRFGPWMQALGRPNVTLVAFDPSGFAGGDLMVDFARRVGLSEQHARAEAIRRNDSLSAEATALLYALQRRIGQRRLAGDLLAGARRTAVLMRGFGHRKFAFSPAALAPGLERQAADIAWVEQRIGHALPAPSHEGKVLFDGTDSLLDFAATQGAALAGHLDAAGLDATGAQADPAAALERVLRGYAAEGPRRRPGGQGNRA